MAYPGLGVRVLATVSPLRLPQFVGRTVMVKNNDVQAAMRLINKLMGQEGMIARFKLTVRYEKPYLTRRRMCFEKAKAIYNEDMGRKIKFLMTKNRPNPFMGTT